MDRIEPVVHQNYLVRSGTAAAEPVQVSSELGIFGVILAAGDAILVNEAAGYCMRTKPAECYENGIEKGSGIVDSLLLT